ncbi:tetratricopeptide repeat protein [Thermodesulfobacteriota bacterium]
MKIRKLKRGNLRKNKGAEPSPRIRMLLNQASSCIKYGRLGQAEDLCREIVQLSPRTSEAFNILGMIYQERGLIDDAIPALHKAVELDGTNANAFFNLGTVLGQKGQYEQAATSLRKSLALAPRTAEARNNLGLALARLGKLDEAIVSLEKATKLDPYYGDAWLNLGETYCCQGQLQKAVDAYQRCIRLIPDFVEAHYNLSVAQHDLKLLPDAIESLQRTIELDPEHTAALHMLAALCGETPDSAPQQFITKLFDQYSNSFETDLVTRLEYRIPTRLRELFSVNVPVGTRLPKVMDLGCGTGLSGQAFHDIADYLAGIDISKKMLEHAGEKKIYDALYVGDLYEQLQQLPDVFDLFIATDVMVYIGNLEPIFNAVSSKTSPGAYFAFSVESQQQNDFTLQPTGRYAHATAYISRLAAASDFTVIAQEKADIRKEDDTWIAGEIYILQKNAA